MRLVSALPTLALAAGQVAMLARRRARTGRLSLDDVALAGVLYLGLVGVLATLLAWLGWFGPRSLTLACLALAVLAWPWRVAAAPAPARVDGRLHAAVLLALVVVGVLVRTPSIPAPLAGRDQGTYVLRAALTARTGTLGFVDEVLARAGREQAEDLLGLYPTQDEPWRRDRYEAAYRPGTYLAARDRGEVVVQFFHLHPMLLAVERVALGEGPGTGHFALPWQAGLWLLIMACVVRRVWPRGPWAALALALMVSSPLAIWTHRTPLSETTMALFEWAALLVALRLRDAPRDASELVWLTALLGLSAWVRGNALIMLPLVLALAWLRPREQPADRRAPLVLLALLLASVSVHALTVYPYVHDELLRRAPALHLSPAALIGLTSAGALAWLLGDRLLGHPSLAALRERVLAWLPRVLALLLVLAFVLWWRARVEADASKPFSRLDPTVPLLGVPLLACAGVGVLVVALRMRPRGRGDAWLLALAGIVPATALFYVDRNLPSLGLFYYGRYLVPELLPCALLACTAALAWSVEWLAPPWSGRLRRVAVRGLGLAGAGWLMWSVAGPLVTTPQVRLREQEGAAAGLAWLRERVPADAIVIAGGEGWHHGHTFNQVGGALALGSGVAVLPYRTREDAWASAWELLLAGPQRRGEPAPRVFLLVNEATHDRRRSDGRRVALLDDQLWPPFAATRIDLLELFIYALTPIEDALPSRVARHELRMGLIELAVDPTSLDAIERIQPRERCLDPQRPLAVELGPGSAPAHLVLVAARGSAARNVAWQVEIDGERLELEPPPGLRPHPRATLGPYPLRERPRVITIRAAADDPADPSARCPHGELAELRLLPRERSALATLAPASIVARSFVPPLPALVSEAKPLEPVTWLGGRSLTRHRPGVRGHVEVVGESLRVAGGNTLEFPLVDLPIDAAGRPLPLELVVTLAGSDARTGTLIVRSEHDGGVFELGRIALPEPRDRVWSAPAIAWQPDRDRAALVVEFHGAPDETVLIRDIASFTTGDGIVSVADQ